MRTAYQGKYFEFMTGDMRRKPVASIEELAEKNFTVYVAHNTYNERPIYQEFDILDGWEKFKLNKQHFEYFHST